MDKETERRLKLLDALEEGGVENWEGYDLATQDYRKAVVKEEKAHHIIYEIILTVGEFINEPKGYKEYYELKPEGYERAIAILLSRAKELCE